MPLALDYHKLFTSTEEVELKFHVYEERVTYWQKSDGVAVCRMIFIKGLPMPVDNVTPTSIIFSNYILDELVIRTIKFSDIKLLP